MGVLRQVKHHWALWLDSQDHVTCLGSHSSHNVQIPFRHERTCSVDKLSGIIGPLQPSSPAAYPIASHLRIWHLQETHHSAQAAISCRGARLSGDKGSRRP